MTDTNKACRNEPSPHTSAVDGPAIHVWIVDDDPIFRSGMAVWLQNYHDFEVIEEMSYGAIVLERLQRYRRDGRHAPLLVIFGGPLKFPSLSHANNYSNLRVWCRQIKEMDPEVKVVIIGSDDGEAVAVAHQANADGYLYKTWGADELLHHLRCAALGEFQWSSNREMGLGDGLTGKFQSPKDGIETGPSAKNKASEDSPSLFPRNPVFTFAHKSKIAQGPMVQLRFRLRLSGLEEIDRQLNQLLPYLNVSPSDARYYVSILDRWIIAGRCRELRTARWAVSRILATPSLDSLDSSLPYGTPLSSGSSAGASPPSGADHISLSVSTMADASIMTPSASPQQDGVSQKRESFLVRWQRQLGAIAQQPIYQATSATVSSDKKTVDTNNPQVNRTGPISIPDHGSNLSTSESSIPITPVSVRATLFDSLRDRLQSPLINQTEHPLEIDILREGKKRELLVLVLHKILILLDDLRYSEVQPQQLQERRSQLLYDLWQSILTDYFGKYYVVQVDGVEREVVAILSQEARTVQAAIFDRIPFAMDVLAHFLFKSPLEIDGVPYSLGTPEAIERAEILLDHLVIQMGNSVIYPLLNYLADVELIKQNFYQRQLMSSREIARFRNTLSWHYRRKQWIEEPTAIFESTYPLFTLNGMGIKQVNIYGSRRTELDQLSGLPLIVTLLLEFRDALSPRLRGAIAAVGSGIIYVLTDLIGRSLGLVARGIIKGLGSAWKDFK